MKLKCATIQTKATEQHFDVVLFIMQYEVFLFLFYSVKTHCVGALLIDSFLVFLSLGGVCFSTIQFNNFRKRYNTA